MASTGEIVVMGNGMARVTELSKVPWMVDPIEVVAYEKLVDFDVEAQDQPEY